MIKQTTYADPAEKGRRVRRCARRLQQGATVQSLRKVYTWSEIEDAQKMLEGKK